MSGDKVDVMFIAHDKFRAVEVKSLKSNDDDLKRGIYQCVKYREVKSAEIAPYEADVEAILVVEPELPLGLREPRVSARGQMQMRFRKHGIRWPGWTMYACMISGTHVPV